jgi:hypothetical protein
MEPEVQKAQAVARSELDTAIDVSRETGWMVVQGVSTTPWGYESWTLDGENDGGLPVVVELSKDR